MENVLRHLCISLILGGFIPILGVTEEWQQPRTTWGDPDLSGVWSNETLTPLERPPGVGVYVTPKEAASARQRIAQARQRDALPRSDEAAPPPKGGSVGAYNLVWIDAGSDVVSTQRSSQVIKPDNGRVPVRAAAVQQRDVHQQLALADMEYMSPWDRCITRGMPGSMLPAGYNNYYSIVQRKDEILIYYEMLHEARIIPLDDRPRLGGSLQFWNGESRGHWQGDTLVVNTKNYKPGWIATSFSQKRIKGIPSTPDMQVEERFTRTSKDTIIWQATITDPAVYTEPWTIELPMVARQDSKVFEYACHECNQAVRNILAGARVEEATQGHILRLEPAADKLIPKAAVIEKLAGGFEFVEGPVWVKPDRLLFSDIPANKVYVWSDSEDVKTFVHPARLPELKSGGVGGSNGLAVDAAGNLILAEHGNRRLARMALSSNDSGVARQRTSIADSFRGKRLNSPNDMVYHSSGSLFFTDPSYGLVGLEESPLREQPHNGIYRLDTDGTLHLMAIQTRPNGIALSPDEGTLIVANSDQAPHKLWYAYDVAEDLTLNNQRVFHDANHTRAEGVPGGLAVDTQGNIFATGPGGVWIFNPQGEKLGLIAPPERPANVAFGEDGRTLFMTARTSLYRIKLNASGLIH